jgi:hypothetical protein
VHAGCRRRVRPAAGPVGSGPGIPGALVDAAGQHRGGLDRAFVAGRAGASPQQPPAIARGLVVLSDGGRRDRIRRRVRRPADAGIALLNGGSSGGLPPGSGPPRAWRPAPASFAGRVRDGVIHRVCARRRRGWPGRRPGGRAPRHIRVGLLQDLVRFRKLRYWIARVPVTRDRVFASARVRRAGLASTRSGRAEAAGSRPRRAVGRAPFAADGRAPRTAGVAPRAAADRAVGRVGPVADRGVGPAVAGRVRPSADRGVTAAAEGPDWAVRRVRPVWGMIGPTAAEFGLGNAVTGGVTRP